MERFVIIMEQAAILIADDNPEIREIIQILLSGEGFQVHEAASGTQALGMLKENTFDLIILDIMMPGISGIETCQQIRSFSYVPILFLTARSSESNKAQGLYAGGDDYLTKPFSYIELVARVRALLRRNECYHYQKSDSTPTETREQLQRHDIILTVNPPQVTVRGILTELTDTEFQLLYLFLKYPTKIFSIQNLYESIWQEPFFTSCANTVMVHIRRLRLKIEKNPQKPTLIQTVWGKGYRFG